jgi:hypothetical protein
MHKAKKRILAPVLDPSASTTPNGREQRRFPRYAAPYTVDMLDNKNRSADGAIRLLDMSALGVGIESAQDLAIGQRLGFKMAIDDGFPVRRLDASARVRWSQAWGFTNAYGLEIEGVHWFNRWRLLRYLRPPRFGALEAASLALEAATAIVVVLVAADLLQSNPHFAFTLFIMMPWLLLVGFGLLATYFLAHKY